MKDIPLSQEELQLIVGTFLRISVGVGSSRPYLNLIDKLDAFIDKPQPEEVKVEKPAEGEVVNA